MMGLKNHFKKMFWEIAGACGVLLLAVTAYMQLGGHHTLVRENLWQIILLASATVFRFDSVVNSHQLEERDMWVNYFITSFLADITLLVLLLWFTPGGKLFPGAEWYMLGVYFAAKTLIYLMMYFNNRRSAREINARLGGTQAE